MDAAEPTVRCGCELYRLSANQRNAGFQPNQPDDTAVVSNVARA